MSAPPECDGNGVRPDGELCHGCPQCDEVRAAAEQQVAVKGMGITKLPELKPGKRHVRRMEIKNMRKIQDVIRVIRESTEYDGKTRTEMALKLAEEVGELAREVLKHEEADGTHYRGKPSEEQLVEEMTDVLIVLVALIEKYEVSDEALVRWARVKIKKWMKVTGDKA